MQGLALPLALLTIQRPLPRRPEQPPLASQGGAGEELSEAGAGPPLSRVYTHGLLSARQSQGGSGQVPPPSLKLVYSQQLRPDARRFSLVAAAAQRRAAGQAGRRRRTERAEPRAARPGPALVCSLRVPRRGGVPGRVFRAGQTMQQRGFLEGQIFLYAKHTSQDTLGDTWASLGSCPDSVPVAGGRRVSDASFR